MTPDQQDILKALTFLYLRHGQHRRALTLILLAARRAPWDIGIMRLSAYAFLANDAPEKALEAVARLEKADPESGEEVACMLLKARALLRAGRRAEARAVFRKVVDRRRGVGEPVAAFAWDPDHHDGFAAQPGLVNT